MTEESTEKKPKRGRRYPLWAKLLLAVAALLFVVVPLEIAARSYANGFPPRALRGGAYEGMLPLCTGLIPPSLDPVSPVTARRSLSRDKPEGQLRIFVFGESSMFGSPYGPEISAATQLYDLLAEAVPDRDIVVVNMGRPGSVIVNTYYHLLEVERYDPDILIFSLGINDGLFFPGEECLAVRHQGLHRAWLSLAERIRFLWVTRVFAPSLLSMAPTQSGNVASCPVTSFPYWTDMLVARASEMAAHVVVTSPVRSDAYAGEDWKVYSSAEDPIANRTDAYLALVACQLDATCDFMARFYEAVELLPPETPDPDLDQRLQDNDEALDGLAAAWRDAASAHGATFVDFRTSLTEASPGGRLIGRYFADEIHLTVAGHGFLARHWLHAVAPHVGFEPPTEPLVPPTPEELTPYHGVVTLDPMVGMRNYLRSGFVLTSVPGLQDLAATCWRDDCTARDEAVLTLDWLRWRTGSPAEFTEERVEELRQFGETLRSR